MAVWTSAPTPLLSASGASPPEQDFECIRQLFSQTARGLCIVDNLGSRNPRSWLEESAACMCSNLGSIKPVIARAWSQS